MNRYHPGSLVAVTAVAIGASCAAAASPPNVTLSCRLETVEHLNCGGGLRPINAPPPDCTQFVSERSLGIRTERFVIPAASLRSNKLLVATVRGGTIYRDEKNKMTFSAVPNLYTDAAGSSVDRGTCHVLSKRPSSSRRRDPSQ